MQDIADRVGLPVIHISTMASVIRSKRAADYEPRQDDDWSSPDVSTKARAAEIDAASRLR